MKIDQVLTLLLAAHTHPLSDNAIKAVIRRLATEDRTTLLKMRLNRFLTPSLHTAVLASAANVTRARELAAQVGVDASLLSL